MLSLTYSQSNENTVPQYSQPAAWTTRLEPSRGVQCQGLPKKIDQFLLDLTQSCAPGRWCDRMSSPCTREVLRHLPTCDQPLLALSRMLITTTSILVPTQPTIAMTDYTHAPTVMKRPPSTYRTSASEIIFRCLW